MSNPIVSHLEDLSVEVLMEIFEYLTVQELYSSVSQLNNRLNSILKSLPNLTVATKTHLDPVLSFFDSFSAVYIQLCPSEASCLSQFNFSNFVGIRLFHIRPFGCADYYIEPIDQLDRLIRPDLCPRLESLRLPVCSTKIAESIFSGAVPHLKICHFGRCKARILPSLTIIRLQALLQLTIPGRRRSEFENIVSICPSLNYLYFSCPAIPTFTRSNPRFLSLRHLRLSRLQWFLFHDGQFDSFLSLFPNLLRFHLTVDQYHQHDETIEFDKVADCLRQRLPHLKLLDWRTYLTQRNRYSLCTADFKMIAQMHSLFKYFGKCDGLLHIASFDFTSKYYYYQLFIRPSSE